MEFSSKITLSRLSFTGLLTKLNERVGKLLPNRSILRRIKGTMMNYQLEVEAEESKLYLNADVGIVKAVWNGTVNVETAKIVLNKGADLIESGAVDKILLDRSSLKEYATETRIWIKNDLLKNRGKKLAPKVRRLAIIESQSSLGSIFSKMLTSAISLVFPKLKIKKFNFEEEATEWLLTESKETV